MKVIKNQVFVVRHNNVGNSQPILDGRFVDNFVS